MTGDWGDEEDGNALGKGERLKGKGGIFFFLFAQCPMPHAPCPISSHEKLTTSNLVIIRFRIYLIKLENKILDNG
ncbi:hypothetical protein VF06_30495 [Nostoc linckia z4]|uniref:Uncharacterized protein n=1 Tax=Nostoc linckia z8 TaxID=1628746 RepID=A0A9Q5ZAI4_NOSLI|nr:hypothetical protein [Nostoc linckia]PHJ58081.1 hypothetical protein VF02_28525 [Nostoc linckia z1]PHJ77135.1 hypothetical protein VF06_30495 [Nostoc linckia z4]PHK02182.1 hypothetical protein VF08_19570 [Nostoc linckia z8]PHK19234.1 hypothetical protein VF11_16405 [Nostoc linckia z14]